MTDIIIVSIDDFEVTERVASTLHSAFHDVLVFARGHDLLKCRELKAQGAHFTVAEPIITLAKTDSAANRRSAFAKLRDKEMVGKLFNELALR